MINKRVKHPNNRKRLLCIYSCTGIRLGHDKKAICICHERFLKTVKYSNLANRSGLLGTTVELLALLSIGGNSTVTTTMLSWW